MTTILDVLEKGTGFLTQKGIKDARLNMELMVAHELGLKRMDLYLRFDQPMEETELTNLRGKLKKRGQGIPLQHINGTIHFHHHEFLCDGRALVPRPETEELVELILKEELAEPARILDVGCGTGVLGLSIAKNLSAKRPQLVLCDLSTDALALAGENAERLEVACELIESDLFSAIEGRFDLIVANLPYIAESERENLEIEVSHDPAMALFSGEDGLDLLRIFAACCAEYLNPGGLVALEVGFDQGEAVAQLLRDGGLVESSVHQDLNGIPRFPLARKA